MLEELDQAQQQALEQEQLETRSDIQDQEGDDNENKIDLDEEVLGNQTPPPDDSKNVSLLSIIFNSCKNQQINRSR